jgi:hypothetical protein
MSAAIGSMTRIERMNYLFGAALVIGAALTTEPRHALGIAVGVALSCLNFVVLSRLVKNWIRPGSTIGRGGFLFLPKTMVLMISVVLALAFLPISGVGLAIGYSVFVISIFVEAIRYLIDPKSTETPDSAGEGSGPH